jgi:hypothetical protein
VNSAKMQIFTATATVTLPVTTTLQVGYYYIIINKAGTTTINTSAGTTKLTLAASSLWGYLVCILASGTTTASWLWMPGSPVS